MQLNDIARLRDYLTVKHHIPGRLRVLFHPALINRPEVKELVSNHSELPPGVTSVRVNALAMSVVIEYDPRRIPPDLLEELVHADEQRVVEVLRELGEKLGIMT
ncbi:HMA2 domain-containing protein [Desulfonatronum thioautotrophicum]|uniref:HMA2 domain-containing protein n=1 Tax=Desulfonatronum thioautotrophicum TaxID=617001 RepID=UPI0005EB866A|nr:hypothetical protein [Desulfonatronum thioautotrophicum]